MMDLLARRDHSEKELQEKLKKRGFSEDEISKALQFAKKQDWIPSTPESKTQLSEKMALGLHRKNKGIIYINHFLKKKGLPPLHPDPKFEVEKAALCLQNKKAPAKVQEKAKLSRFLLSRGFQLETIRKVLK
jgi:regulatory protein